MHSTKLHVKRVICTDQSAWALGVTPGSCFYSSVTLAIYILSMRDQTLYSNLVM